MNDLPDNWLLHAVDTENGMSVSAGGPPLRGIGSAMCYDLDDELLLVAAKVEATMCVSAGGPPPRALTTGDVAKLTVAAG